MIHATEPLIHLLKTLQKVKNQTYPHKMNHFCCLLQLLIATSVNTLEFNTKIQCQIEESFHFQLHKDETQITALTPKNVIATYLNFFKIFLNTEKKSKENNYIFFQKPTTCYDQGCTFLSVYNYPSLKNENFTSFQTKDTINENNCILNYKTYNTKSCYKIFQKLQLKIAHNKTNTQHKYIKIHQNGTIILGLDSLQSSLCTCDVQHFNLDLEKNYYKKSIAKIIFTFLDKTSTLLQEIPKPIELISGKENCTLEQYQLNNNEIKTLYSNLYQKDTKFEHFETQKNMVKLNTIQQIQPPTCTKAQKNELNSNLNLIKKLLRALNTETKQYKRNINLLNFLGFSTASQLQDIYANERKIHSVEESITKNEKIINDNLNHLTKYISQENEFFHKLHAKQQSITQQLQTIKQESHKTKTNFFTHLHLYQTKFNYMINYNKFNVYTAEIEKILDLALKQDSKIHITTDTIFIKTQVLKYNKLNTITYNCIPNTEGLVFNIHRITHKNGTILDVTFINHKKTSSTLAVRQFNFSCPPVQL